MAPTQVFINLPVKDLDRSKAFFAKLGYSFNPQFTDANAACMVVSDTIYVMLLAEPFFQGFLGERKIAPKGTTEVLVALSHPSRDAVEGVLAKALAAGGRAHREPQDLGFMYSRAFEDLDGHVWEHLWMDPKHVQG